MRFRLVCHAIGETGDATGGATGSGRPAKTWHNRPDTLFRLRHGLTMTSPVIPAASCGMQK